MRTLAHTLKDLDGKGYKAYKSLLGEYPFEGWTLIVDHVQADPFAAPSRMRAVVDTRIAALPDSVFRSASRKMAARDYIARAFRDAVNDEKALSIDAGRQTVLGSPGSWGPRGQVLHLASPCQPQGFPEPPS